MDSILRDGIWMIEIAANNVERAFQLLDLLKEKQTMVSIYRLIHLSKSSYKIAECKLNCPPNKIEFHDLIILSISFGNLLNFQ